VISRASADDLLRDAEAQLDRTIVELAVEEGNRLLAAGATVDDLPGLMQPFVEAVRQWRADTMADAHARVRWIRLIEAGIALNEALIAEAEACVAQVEACIAYRGVEGLAVVH
jgi:hypothetical protein